MVGGRPEGDRLVPICGAENQSGGSCHRLVVSGRCWQHARVPADALSAASALVAAGGAGAPPAPSVRDPAPVPEAAGPAEPPVGVMRQRFAAELAHAFERNPAWRPILGDGVGADLSVCVAGFATRHAWRTFSYRRRGGCEDMDGLARAVAVVHDHHGNPLGDDEHPTAASDHHRTVRDVRQSLRAGAVEQGASPTLTTLLADMASHLLHATPGLTTAEASLRLAQGLRLVGVAWCAALGRDPLRCACLDAVEQGSAGLDGTGAAAAGPSLAEVVAGVAADLHLAGMVHGVGDARPGADGAMHFGPR